MRVLGVGNTLRGAVVKRLQNGMCPLATIYFAGSDMCVPISNKKIC